MPHRVSDTASTDMTICNDFQDVCALQCLEELQGESAFGCDDQDGDYVPPIQAPLEVRSDFYPINSRSKCLDLFQKNME